MMYSNIVKIKQDNLNRYGTGVVVSTNVVLTAAHVVSSEENVMVVCHDISFVGWVSFQDEYIALITMNNPAFEKWFVSQVDLLLFTEQELFSSNQKWEIQGYRSASLIEHSIKGTGLYLSSTPKVSCDYEVGRIDSGALQDYRGISGSPVICNERAVGIAQIQHLDKAARLSIGFTSIDKFVTNLPIEALAQSKYIFELQEEGYNQPLSEIVINKCSGKYIPEIFVEENEYKEDLRYFCDPILFIKKSIEDLQTLDFSNVNKYLRGNEISFSEYNIEISQENFQGIYETLHDKIRSTIRLLEQADNDNRRAGTMPIEHKCRHQAVFNNSLKWDLEKICEKIEFINKRVILITRNAGQGKTNFLCDFTENFLAKKHIPSFYFNAAGFVEKPSIQILHKITSDEKWPKDYVCNELEKLWETTGKFVVVVIDGLNENTTLNHFGRFIEESIKELLKYPYIKLIMATRNEMFEERFGNLSAASFGDQFCRLDMGMYREDKFNDRIFEGYLKFFDVEIAWNTLWESTYNQLVVDTLLLRFFCEVNRGRRQVYMYDIYKYSLFEKYYTLKKNELIEKEDSTSAGIRFDRLIEHIAQYMIEFESFSQVPFSILNEDDICILDNLLETDVIFKKEIIIKKGFVQKKEEVFSFTFDEFRDFCLTQYLVSLDDAPKQFPVVWKTMHANKWSIVEGIEKYVFFLSRTRFSELESLIRQEPNYHKLYWNNVWSLEECDFRDEDVSLWRKLFLVGGIYTYRIASFLINRRDRNYFTNTSIDVLFEMFIELSKVPWKFDEIIHMLFPVRKTDRYNQEILQKGYVLYCDQFIESIKNKLSDAVDSVDCRDALRLSLVMYHMMPRKINELWRKAYTIVPKQVIGILEDYNDIDGEAVFLKYNYRDVINGLIRDIEDPRVFVIENKAKNNIDYIEVSDLLMSIWK